MQGSVGAWDRRRLLLTLAGVAAAAVLLLGGLVYAVVWALGSATAGDTAPAAGPVHVDVGVGTTAEQRRDAIAAAPMAAVPASAATSGTPAPVAGPTITVPAATTVGPARGADRVPAHPAGRGRAARRDRHHRPVRHVHRAHRGRPRGVGAARRPTRRASG